MRPGEIIPAADPVPLNPGLPRTHVEVCNKADRPVQVGSHYHFAAVNPGLHFDRGAAWGLRLNIPAGTAVRFEPNVPRVVSLVPIEGNRVVPGLREEYAGKLDERGPEAPPETPKAGRPGRRRPKPEPEPQPKPKPKSKRVNP